MTTPTNWPNPERPGVPMFPEQSGTHILKYRKQCPAIWWDANFQCWFCDGVDKQPATPETVARRYSYAMICLLPGQITQLLAGERKRCAKVCEDEYEKSGRDFEYLGCLSCSETIRNLGDAP